MPRVELSAGGIDYQDTGGDGPVLVFTHGFPMNGSQWRKVVPRLAGYRCVLPTLPLGAHRTPMKPDADLTQRGIALLLGEFLEALDLTDVTLVMNDWGGAQFLVTEGEAGRVARMAMVACEAFDNFPPAPARPLTGVAKVPGGVWLLMQLFRLRFFRHDKRAYGGLTRHGIPDEVLDDWFAPATASRRIRRDLAKFATSAPPREVLLEWSERLRDFDRPVLVVWATDDMMMPPEHGEKLTELLPNAQLVEIADSGTLIPEDQPEELVRVLTAFLAQNGAEPVRP
ncbi:pimeloyl-ACP methyl ester carboxylesterase [Haloactinopolyspora alba]|uniref:Pimeloyl-ACP methyl ester carboxylesterase n=1 Tax=Haloactinopolyspora alba TaxID=648780 RepID=A0A2P8E547_9ACTN|nr:alpha/beta hydrolase [Haloactinopolyspora alba]PSL04582.1 pimeloyl-ACP methyl ester carboxylesterase [Haloactinopolyspora alba]